MTVSSVLAKLKSKTDLAKEDLAIIVHEFEQKKLNNEDIKDLVIAWREKKETSFEIATLAEILNSKQKQPELSSGSIDMCGTGGDNSNTFNISTLSAIVASSCGAKVIKHSGRSTTSITGSVDILSQFGLNIDTPDDVKEICFKESGLIFVSSFLLREVFGEVKKVCKEINIPGFINLIGPLTNPYKTSYYLLGVSKIEWGDLMAEALKLQYSREGFVVCSKVRENFYLDELSFCGINYIWRISNSEITKEVVKPDELGIKAEDFNNLVVKDINESKSCFEAILRGSPIIDSKLRVVALNSGAALYLTKRVKSIHDGYSLALRHIKSGKVWEHFQNFINCSKKRRV